MHQAAAHGVVELVAVDEQQALAARGGVDCLGEDFDIEQGVAAQLAAVFVVVAGDVYHPGAPRRQGEQFAQHRLVTLRPQEVTFHGPEIHHIPHQVDHIGAGPLEKVQQEFRPASLVAEVDVRQPDAVDLGVGHAGDLSHGNGASRVGGEPAGPHRCGSRG